MRLQLPRSIYFLALFGAIILLAPTLLNSYPIFYPDSSTYVRGPDYAIRKIVSPRLATIWSTVEVANDKSSASEAKSETGKTILSGRSVYYGLLVYLGYVAGDFWLTAFLQAYIIAAIIGLLFFRCWEIFGPKKYLLTLAFLSVLTPLGFFAGFMMPDIFASVAILATMIAFVYWQQLKVIDIIFLGGLLVLSFVSHSSHIALTLAIFPLLVIISIFSKKERVARFRALAFIIVCLAAAGALELTFYQTTLKITGRPPLRLPYLTARLIELGPGLRYLDQACAPPQYAVCAYRAQLPTYWTAFLFDTDARTGVFAPADFATKRQLSEEQARFALYVFLFEPGQVIRGLVYDFGQQLVRFSFVDQKMTYQFSAFLRESYPQQISEEIKASNIFRHPEILRYWSTINYGVVILAIAAVAFGLFKLRDNNNEMESTFTLSLWITVLGVLANAFVCGVLASPLDRFQARVIWLVPLLAVGTWFMTQRQGSPIIHSGRPAKIPMAG
jgi:hypothetical protein